MPQPLTLSHHIARLRSLASFMLVAMAQFLSPSAAADPASKIDPPAWSYRHSQQEIQTYGARARDLEPKTEQKISQARLHRLLRQYSAPPKV